MSEFLTPDFLQVFIPLVAAVIAWLANEFSKRKAEEYSKKEEKYRALLASLRGFYIGPTASPAREKKQDFLNLLDQCWLYCPDEVIRNGYAFLMTVHTAAKKSDVEKEKALGEFIVSIRKDLYSTRSFFRRTTLRPDEFKILGAT